LDVSEFEAFVMIEWMKQRDLLIEEAFAFAQRIAANSQKMPRLPYSRRMPCKVLHRQRSDLSL
jgi:hypothetical protein